MGFIMVRLIMSEYKVPEEIRRQRRRRNPSKPNSKGRAGNSRTSETAPQSEGAPSLPKVSVYVVDAENQGGKAVEPIMDLTEIRQSDCYTS